MPESTNVAPGSTRDGNHLNDSDSPGKREPSEYSPLSLEAIRAILDASKSNVRDYAILLLATDTAARADELCFANVNDLRIPEDDSMSTIELSSAKGRRARKIPVPAKTIEAIERYMRICRPNAQGDESLFSSRTGHRLSSAALRVILRKHAETARQLHPELFRGADVRFMDLRHSVVAHLIGRGADACSIGHFLGCVPCSPFIQQHVPRNSAAVTRGYVPSPEERDQLASRKAELFGLLRAESAD